MTKKPCHDNVKTDFNYIKEAEIVINPPVILPEPLLGNLRRTVYDLASAHIFADVTGDILLGNASRKIIPALKAKLPSDFNLNLDASSAADITVDELFNLVLELYRPTAKALFFESDLPAGTTIRITSRDSRVRHTQWLVQKHFHNALSAITFFVIEAFLDGNHTEDNVMNPDICIPALPEITDLLEIISWDADKKVLNVSIDDAEKFKNLVEQSYAETRFQRRL